MAFASEALGGTKKQNYLASESTGKSMKTTHKIQHKLKTENTPGFLFFGLVGLRGEGSSFLPASILVGLSSPSDLLVSNLKVTKVSLPNLVSSIFLRGGAAAPRPSHKIIFGLMPGRPWVNVQLFSLSGHRPDLYSLGDGALRTPLGHTAFGSAFWFLEMFWLYVLLRFPPLRPAAARSPAFVAHLYEPLLPSPPLKPPLLVATTAFDAKHARLGPPRCGGCSEGCTCFMRRVLHCVALHCTAGFLLLVGKSSVFVLSPSPLFLPLAFTVLLSTSLTTRAHLY